VSEPAAHVTEDKTPTL